MAKPNANLQKAQTALEQNAAKASTDQILDVRSNLEALLIKHKAQLQRALPGKLSIDRLIRVALTAASRQPKLLKCTPASFLGAVIQSAQLGLDPDGALGHAYLIPYLNKKHQPPILEVQFMIGYKGYIELANRTNQLKGSPYAQMVCKNDEFDYEYGANPTLRHKPLLSGERGPVIAFYAYAHPKSGGFLFEVMPKVDVDRIRASSKAKDDGPWVEHYDEMGRKTAIRRLQKYLPLTPQLARAIQLDEMLERGDPQGLTLGSIEPIEEPADAAFHELNDRKPGSEARSLPPAAQSGGKPEEKATTGTPAPAEAKTEAKTGAADPNEELKKKSAGVREHFHARFGEFNTVTSLDEVWKEVAGKFEHGELTETDYNLLVESYATRKKAISEAKKK